LDVSGCPISQAQEKALLAVSCGRSCHYYQRHGRQDSEVRVELAGKCRKFYADKESSRNPRKWDNVIVLERTTVVSSEDASMR
jgi:hypothetical protein